MINSPSELLSRLVLGLIGAGAIFTFLSTWYFQPPLSDNRWGLLFGTIMPQVLSAATWMAWGPGQLRKCLGWSLLWVGLIGGSFAAGVLMHGHGWPIVDFVGEFFLFWAVGQIPAWLLAHWLRLQIAIPSDSSGIDIANERPRTQFGLRQLMTFTLQICIFFGIARALYVIGFRVGPYELQNMILFFGAPLLIHFSLTLAALRQRRALAGTAVALLFIVAMTAAEIAWRRPELSPIMPTAIYCMHGMIVAWTLAFALAVRSCGYRLVMMSSQPAPFPGERE